MSFKQKDSSYLIFWSFILVWGLINLIQAYFSPLDSDEAYYWMYSRYLSWGYFDHPPMIALMIKTGYSLFSNELGLRLFGIIAQLFTLLIIWSITSGASGRSKESALFLILLIVSMPLINIFSFISTPDSPLIFFEALFLYLYKKSLEKNSWETWLLLGITMAAIMYSKYHGALLIILVIISDLKLLRSTRFYFSVLVALVLFVPHIYWQYTNDFPSIKFHLVDRVNDLSFKEVPEFLYNTLLTHNPLILPVAVYLILRYRNQDKFERSLSFIIFGTLLFFLFASFRYHVEPHWTAIITLPLIILLLNKIHSSGRIYNYLKTVTFISLFLMLFARSAFIIDFLPVNYLKTRYFDAETRCLEIEKIAEDRPVIFTNSYQNAARYTYYTKQFSHSLNDLFYRKNQFDLWDFEEQLHGKNILYVPHWFEGNFKSLVDKYLTAQGDSIFAKKFSNFQSIRRECCILPEMRYYFRQNNLTPLEILIFNPYPFQLDFRNENFPVTFHAGFFKNGTLHQMYQMQLSEDIRTINPGDTIKVTGSFTTNEIPIGEYNLAICSISGIQYAVCNSKSRDVTITK